jgi:hypothetical protein
MSAEDDLHALLGTTLGRDMRKRRLLRSASLRLVLTTLPDGPVAEVIRVSAEFAEWWVYADLEDEGLDERSQLIRSYDRRQLRNPILQQIESVLASEFPGTPSTRRLVEFFALQAASGLLCDDYDWRNLGNSEQALNSALAAISGTQQPTNTPRREDRTGASRSAELQLVIAREIFGNPSRPVRFYPEWRTDTAVALARAIHSTHDFFAMPILADALQDAGCDNDAILNHCRDTRQAHVRGCWVVDLVLGKS